MTMIVDGYGPLDAKLWIIAKGPRPEEEKQARLFTVEDGTGRFLKQKLVQAAIKDENVRFEVLVGQRPPKNDFKFFREGGLKEIAEKSISQLRDRIAENKPNVLLLLGPEVLDEFVGVKDVDKWRGHIIELANGQKAISTYEPAYCLRQRNYSKKYYPGSLEALFAADLVRAKDESAFPNPTYPDYSLIIQPTFAQTASYLEENLEKGEILSFDIETVRPYAAHFMDCIGFSTSLDNAICIPFWIPTLDVPVPYWKSREEYLHIFGLVKRILESEIPKVAQNSQFDILVLREYYGIETRNLVWDTMLAQHNLYCELPKDLGTLTSLYTKLPYHKHLIGEGGSRGRWEYNAMDALANLHVMEGQLKEMQDPELDILDHYVETTNPAIMPLIEMQRVGVKVDEDLMALARNREMQIMQDIERALDEALPIPIHAGTDSRKFNPNSVDQKRLLFYTLLQCKKVYDKGTLSTNESSLKKVRNKTKHDYVKTLVDACIQYKNASYMLSKLNSPTRNGRLHTKYGLGGLDQAGDELGTTTGRLNSSASDILNVWDNAKHKWVPAGTNMQNLAKGIQRASVIPDEGEEFCHVDLYAAEAYIVAADARELKILKMLDRGEKIHKWLEDIIREKFPVECANCDFTYKKAKMMIHGMNYNAQPEILAFQTGLPVAVTEWVFAFYHSKFPGIKMRMRAIEDQIKKSRSLVSLLGRRRQFFAPLTDELKKQAYAWPSQSVIGEITIKALTRLYYWGQQPDMPFIIPALNTHDGVISRVKLNTRKEIKELVKNAFNIKLVRDDIEVTVPVEIAWGPNFNEATDTEILWYKQ